MKYLKSKSTLKMLLVVSGLVLGLGATYAFSETTSFSKLGNELIVKLGATFNASATDDKKVVITSDGKVGIGTAFPKANLSVGGAGYDGTAIYGGKSSYVGVYGETNRDWTSEAPSLLPSGVIGLALGVNGSGVRGSGAANGVYGDGSTGVYGAGATNGGFGIRGYGDTGVFGKGVTYAFYGEGSSSLFTSVDKQQQLQFDPPVVSFRKDGTIHGTIGAFGTYPSDNSLGISGWNSSKVFLSSTKGIDLTGDTNIAGTVTAPAYYYSSDLNLKKNIVPLSGQLEKVSQLQGVSFDWKKDSKHSLGLIAQEVEEVYPELVSTDKTTGLKSVEYGNLVAPLIEAVKEQQIQIGLLKKEIEKLKNK